MTPRPILRDLALLAFAAVLGWWAHGANTAVRAAAHPSPSEDFSFQFGDSELRGALALYSPADHKLYVYPGMTGSSHISCAYSLKVERPGLPVERTNCAPGSPY